MIHFFYIVFFLFFGWNVQFSKEKPDDLNHPKASKEINSEKSSKKDPKPIAKVKQLPVPMHSPLAKAMMPILSATKTYTQIGLDVGPAGPGPGDSLRYEVIISNEMGTMDALGVNFMDEVDPNTTLIPESVNSSPIAVDDSYSTVGNVSISVPAGSGLLLNDIELDGDNLEVISVNTVDTDGDVTFTADGSFTFNPAPGFEGSTTFDYTLSDGVFDVTGTVTIEVSGMIWFINSAAPAGGDGRLNSPYNTITGYNTLAQDGVNENIFIYSGSYTGGISMLDSQKVIGQGAVESLNVITGLSAPAYPPISGAMLPSTGGTNPTISGTVTVLSLASDNEVYGLTINNSGSTSISGASVGDFKIRNVSISNGSGPALDISNGALDVIFTSLSSSNATFGARITNTTGSIQVQGSGTTDGSGGTFSNIVQRGIELNNVTNATLRNLNMNNANTGDAGFAGVCDEQNNLGCFSAIYLRDANGVTLNNINITGTEEHGINGNNVNNLSVVNCVVTLNGDAEEENALKFRNLTGNCTFMNSTFSFSAYRIAHIINTTGSLTLNVTGCTFNNTISSAVGQDCFEVRTFSTAVATVNLANSNFWRAGTKAIQAIAEGSSTLNININNCRVERFGGNMAGIDVGSVGSATINYNIVNNPVIESALEVAVLASTFNTSNLNGRVNNNSGINHSPASQTVFANVRILHEMNSVGRIEMINNNGVTSVNTAQGILAVSRLGTIASSRLDFTLDGNTISNLMNPIIEGIELRTGQATSPAETNTLCANVENNNVTVPADNRAFRVRIINPSSILNLQGPGPDVMSNWSGNNNVNSIPSTIVSFASAPATISFGSVCNTPSHSPAPLMSEIMEMISRSGDESEQIEPIVNTIASTLDNKGVPAVSSTENHTTDESIQWANTNPETAMMPMNGMVSYSNFILPAGKELIIRFDVSINDPFPTSVCEVSNQGTISGSNFTAFSTDDPSAPGTSDPTLTTMNIEAVILACQEDISVNTDPNTCEASVTFSTSVNGCPSPTVTYSIDAVPITSPHVFPVGTTTVNVVVSNGIGMDTTCSFVVTVADNQLPTAICTDVTRQLDIDREASIEVMDINNGSMDACGISNIELSKLLFTCEDLGENTVIMTVTDNNGNTNTCAATVNILDDDNPCCDPPVANCISEVEVFLDEMGLYTLSASEVDNNSEADCGIQSLSVFPNSFACEDIGGGISVTLTVTDDNDNTATCESTITVLDTIPPVASCQNIEVDLESDGTATVNAEDVNNNSSDACDIAGFSLTPNMFSCNDLGSNLVVLTVTDVNSNTNTCTATITVLDVTPPTPPDAPADITIACVDDLPTTPELTASDVCDGDITVSGVDTDNAGVGCMIDPLVITRTWTFTDASDNSSLSVQTITVIDSIPPVINTEAMDIIVECDGEGNTAELLAWLDIHGESEATDNCISNVTWTNNYDPSNFVSACGLTGSVNVVFTATDECGNTSQTTASFTIEDKTPPTITTAAMDITAECDGGGNDSELQVWLSNHANAEASDICSGPIVWTNDYSPMNFVEGCGATGSVEVVFTATDDCGNTSQTTATFTIEDNTVPEIDTSALDMTVECDGEGNAMALQAWLNNQGGASATDNCSGSVVWSNDYNTDNFVSGCGLTGSVEVVFTATDDCNLTSQTTATFTIEDMTPPSITAGAMDVTVECDGEGNIAELQSWLDTQANAIATDECSEPIVWSNDYDPANFVPSCGFSGSVIVLFTATDDCGNFSETSATFTIEDTVGPSIDTEASDSTVECDGSGNAVQLQAWLDSNGGAAASDDCSSELQWTNDYIASNFVSACGTTGHVEVTFTVTDECDQIAETTARFIIIDTTPPEISTLPQDLTVECDGSGNTAQFNDWLSGQGGAEATDICSPYTWEIIPENPVLTETCGASGTSTVSFVVVDECGNSSSATATFTIEDTTAPTVVCENTTVVLQAEGEYQLTDDDVLDFSASSDICDPNLEVLSVFPAMVDCNDLNEPVEVLVTIADACGNESACVSTITVLQGEALPGGFTQNFIGNTTGEAIFEPCKVDGTFTISSTGYSSSTSDRQNFVSQTLCGDGEIFARIVSIDGGGFAGVQMRENLTPGSRKAVLKTQLNYFVRREVRANPNGPAQSQQMFRPQNMWLKLVRNGNTFSGFTSPDGVSWSFAFAANIAMGSCIHMGLISESIGNTTLTTVEFDQVSSTGAGIGSPNPQSQITNVTEITLYPNPTNGQVMLQWPQSMKYEKAEIFIYNNMGQVMYKDVITQGYERTLNLNMPAGIYHVNVLLDNEAPMVKRLVIH